MKKARFTETQIVSILKEVDVRNENEMVKHAGRGRCVRSLFNEIYSEAIGGVEPYSASKHAVEGLSETLDHEVRKFGVRITLVEPSFTKTSMDSMHRKQPPPFQPTDTERGVVSPGHSKQCP